jgi:hypothetical protein
VFSNLYVSQISELDGAFVLTGITSSAEVSPGPLTDLQATAKTRELYSRLQKQSGHGVLFGHQDTTPTVSAGKLSRVGQT